jgi:hypothetical protein
MVSHKASHSLQPFTVPLLKATSGVIQSNKTNLCWWKEKLTKLSNYTEHTSSNQHSISTSNKCHTSLICLVRLTYDENKDNYIDMWYSLLKFTVLMKQVCIKTLLHDNFKLDLRNDTIITLLQQSIPVLLKHDILSSCFFCNSDIILLLPSHTLHETTLTNMRSQCCPWQNFTSVVSRAKKSFSVWKSDKPRRCFAHVYTASIKSTSATKNTMYTQNIHATNKSYIYRDIHKSLRDFRTLQCNNQDRHSRKEHING